MLLQYISLSIIHVFLFISLRCPDPIPPRNFWKINNTKSKLGHPSPANKITHWWKVLDPRLNRYIFSLLKPRAISSKEDFSGNLKYLSLRSKFGLGLTTSVTLWGPPAGVKLIVTWRVQWAGQKASVESRLLREMAIGSKIKTYSEYFEIYQALDYKSWLKSS